MGAFVDLTGQTFNRLTVIRRHPKNINDRPAWVCQCSCGNTTIVKGADLKSGNTKSCGCYKIERTKEVCRKSYLGNRYGRLVVIEELDEYDSSKHRKMLCKCDCGNIIKVAATSLTTGNTQSCGCISSKGEAKIQQILTDNNIKFKKEFIFNDLISERGGHLRFDFAILKDNDTIDYLVEYDGIQHFEFTNNGWMSEEKFNITQNNDRLKNQYCLNNNIKLVRIKYNEEISLERIRGGRH
jgi:hypothetical protein